MSLNNIRLGTSLTDLMTGQRRVHELDRDFVEEVTE